jgi:tetratricopeptide (TPR) repeat protein
MRVDYRKYSFATLFLSLLTGALFLYCKDPDLTAAKTLLESGDYLAARAIYEKAASAHPDDFAARYGLGMSWCAEAIYKTELGLADPDDWYPAIYQMTVASHLQPSGEARRTLAILHYNLGACYKKLGQPRDALRRIKEAVSYDSTLLKAYNMLGALYQDEGDLDKAESCYRRTLLLKPDYAMAHFNLGALSWARNDFKGALQHFLDAAAIEPENSSFQGWLTKARTAADKR